MVRDLNEVEICLYTHEFMFVYDLYKSHNKNYEVTLEDITMIASNNYNKENYHKILLDFLLFLSHLILRCLYFLLNGTRP